MNDLSTPSALAALPEPGAPVSAGYAPPSLIPLGSVGTLTAGPDQSPDKHLDQLFGGTGGFADSTS